MTVSDNVCSTSLWKVRKIVIFLHWKYILKAAWTSSNIATEMHILGLKLDNKMSNISSFLYYVYNNKIVYITTVNVMGDIHVRHINTTTVLEKIDFVPIRHLQYLFKYLQFSILKINRNLNCYIFIGLHFLHWNLCCKNVCLCTHYIFWLHITKNACRGFTLAQKGLSWSVLLEDSWQKTSKLSSHSTSIAQKLRY